MKRNLVLGLLVFSSVIWGVSQETPSVLIKPKATTPAFTAEQQTKLQAIVIQKQNVQLELSQLQNQYQADLAKISRLETEGHKLETEYLKAANVDPDKFTTRVDEKGQLLIVEK